MMHHSEGYYIDLAGEWLDKIESKLESLVILNNLLTNEPCEIYRGFVNRITVSVKVNSGKAMVLKIEIDDQYLPLTIQINDWAYRKHEFTDLESSFEFIEKYFKNFIEA